MHLFFDLDGTLTDPFEGITRCIAHALAVMGRPCPPFAELRWCIGPPLRKSLAVLLGSDDENLVEETVSAYRERFGSVGLFENRVYEGIPEMLQTLSSFGHTLYVATAKPWIFAERIVDHFGLSGYFKGIYGCELDGERGDKTSLIAHILDAESIDSSETAMIGDREHDITGAKANRIPAFGVLWGYGTRAELEAAGARACFGNPREIPTAFNGADVRESPTGKGAPVYWDRPRPGSRRR